MMIMQLQTSQMRVARLHHLWLTCLYLMSTLPNLMGARVSKPASLYRPLSVLVPESQHPEGCKPPHEAGAIALV